MPPPLPQEVKLRKKEEKIKAMAQSRAKARAADAQQLMQQLSDVYGDAAKAEQAATLATGLTWWFTTLPPVVAAIGSAGVPGALALVLFILLSLRAGVRRGQIGTTAATGGLFLAGVAASGTILTGFFFAWAAFAGRAPEEGEEGAHA